MDFSDNNIKKVEDLEDGSTIYEIGDGTPISEDKESSFYANLAESDFTEETLKRISAYLLDAIEKDVQSSEAWMNSIKKVKDYLGFDIEQPQPDPDLASKEFTRTYDSTLATALVRFYSTTRAEILPQSGPVGYKVNGVSNEMLEDKGLKVQNWYNYYLTIDDKAYYSDYEKFLLHLGFNGSAVRKVYYDKLLKKPLSRFIRAEDFIIDGDCTSILESARLTQVLHLSKREILLNQQNKIYRDVELTYLKSSELPEEMEKKEDNKDFNLKVYEKRSLFPIYECHVYLDLNDFGAEVKDEFPLPYIVILDPTSKNILSIRRNWEEDNSSKERINYFIQYNYLPGFGVRGLGLAHLIGSNSINLTTILRQLVDAGKFKNLPAGFRQKGMGQQDNNFVLGMGEWKEINTGGTPLGDFFMPLPYAEPSQALRELRLEIMNQTKELGSTSEMGMMDSREDIPTGTALAFLETNNRISSAVLRSIHYSFSQELQLIDRIFRKTINEDFAQNIHGKEIGFNDFIDEIEIIPIADPAHNSSVQRMMKAQAMMQLATQAPDLHNMREVFKLNYSAQGLDEQDIEKILKPDPQEEETLPLDPVTENINILQGKPVIAAIWQDHAAHKLVHAMFAQQHPELEAPMMAHIKEHDAYLYLVTMQQLLGEELPPLEYIKDPQIQNNIALSVAQALGDSDMDIGNEGESLDPNALLMADIKQKEEEIKARERIAMLKAETDIFKTQLDFEKEKAKIESNEDIAQLKSETELQKQGVLFNE